MFHLVILIHFVWVVLVHEKVAVEHQVRLVAPIDWEEGHDITSWTSRWLLNLLLLDRPLNYICFVVLLDKPLQLVIICRILMLLEELFLSKNGACETDCVAVYILHVLPIWLSPVPLLLQLPLSLFL